ncbi:MAG: hypothetical protein VX768_07780, partial [Planctomycetota bacterium]|nr:hypothetical protein [Planctomycetota bacterium]
SGIRKNGWELEEKEVTIQPANDASGGFSNAVLTPNLYSSGRILYSYSTGKGSSNPVVLQLSDGLLVAEKDVRQLKLGSEVLATFSETGEVDHYRFEAKKGDRIWIEVISQRLGIGTDPLLTIEQARVDGEGKETFRSVASSDDFEPLASPFRLRLATEDPALLFEAPADGVYRISVNDQFNLPPQANGPNYYQLSFKKPEQRVDLVAIAGLERGPNDNNARPLKISPCLVRPDGGAEIQVFAYRSPGFDAPIDLEVEGLPPGVTAAPAAIAGQDHHGTLVLRGDPQLKSGFSQVRIRGVCRIGGKEIRLPVAAAEITTNSIANEPSECRLTDTMYVVADATTEFPGRIELSQKEFRTSRGGQVEVKARLKKTAGHQGPILQAGILGLPRTVSKPSLTIQDNGAEASYKLDFRTGSPAGVYSVFIRGYFEKNTGRFEKRFEQVTAEQKRVAGLLQKVESEYRKVGQEKQRLNSRVQSTRQAVSRMATQVRSAGTKLDQAEKNLALAEKNKNQLEKEVKGLGATVTSLGQMANLEMDAARKKQLADQLAAKKREQQGAVMRLTKAGEEYLARKKALDSARSAHAKLKTEQEGLQREILKMEKEQEGIAANESRLGKDRTEGQNIKRELDAELNLARQASQQRRRRFHVHSDPIRIEVKPYPVTTTLSQSRFSLEQGASQKIRIQMKREFDYQGTVTFQLRPENGVSGWAFKTNPKLSAQQESVEAEIFVQKYAKPGQYTGQVVATLRVGNTNLSQSLPISMEIRAAAKK